MAKYYDFAVQRASNCFKRKKGSSAFWDNRIEEENVVRDAAIDALQNVYTKYDPDKGALESYLSRAVHNEVVDKLEKEMKCLSMVKDITLEQEKEYTLDDLASSVSSAAMLNMKERLENAMKELKPVDQVILAYFIDDPSSFVDRAAEELGIPCGRVSVRKTRAIETLSRLLEKSVEDYDESVFFKLPYSRDCRLMFSFERSSDWSHPFSALGSSIFRLCISYRLFQPDFSSFHIHQDIAIPDKHNFIYVFSP